MRAIRRRPILAWLGVAAFGVAAGAALSFAIGPSEESPVSAGTQATAPPTAGGPPPGATSTGGAGSAVAPPAAEAAATASATEADADAAGAVAPPVVTLSYRLRIPALGIDAPIVALGFDGSGQLDVPSDGVTAGWYEISSPLGADGNALLGAHVDWAGELALFWRLGELVAGDRVYLTPDQGEELVYEVAESTSVNWDSPVSEVLATANVGSSLTLFTCGGDFDTARGGYDRRLIVRAAQVTEA
jgi:LPXTG-site transpeptidase (sortase) family protein